MFGPTFTIKLLLDVLREVKPNSADLGAHHYVQLAESDILEQVDPADLDTIQFLCPAGSAVPSSLQLRLKKKFKNLKAVTNLYGQTEAGLVSIGYESSNIGMIVPLYKVKIEDPNTGKSFCKHKFLWFGVVKTVLLKSTIRT